MRLLAYVGTSATEYKLEIPRFLNQLYIALHRYGETHRAWTLQEQHLFWLEKNAKT
jgi:hypothetical protein